MKGSVQVIRSSQHAYRISHGLGVQMIFIRAFLKVYHERTNERTKQQSEQVINFIYTSNPFSG